MTQSKYISDAAEFYKLLADPKVNVLDWHILNDDLVLVDTQPTKDFIPKSNMTNIFIAAAVTAYGRRALNHVLMCIGPERLLYWDTDSVIFIHRPGLWRPQCGVFLGEMTDELPPGHHIVIFCSTGPKCYCFMLDDGTCSIKVKGFTLNHANSKKLHFHTMCDELFLWHFHSQTGGISLKNPSEITRHKNKAIIYNKPLSKSYQVVYTKRVVQDDFTTLPYGYCE